MNSLSAAQAAWETASIPNPLPHRQSYGKIVEEPFRKYGDAIAWVEWEENCIILKLETMKPRTGASTALISFLKTLAIKHGISIYANPVPYQPTCPLAAASSLSQEGLLTWYFKNAFEVGRDNNDVPYICYPVRAV